jgi:hypothetical protein
MNLIVPNSVKRCFVGIWLTFLYVICVNLVVFSLSTCLFQMKLNSLLKKSTGGSSPLIEHYCDTSAIEDDAAQGALSLVPCIPMRAVVKETYFTAGEILVHYNKMTYLKEDYNKAYPYWEEAARNLSILDWKLEEAIDDKTRQNLEIEKNLLLENKKLSQVPIDRFRQETEGQLSSIFIEIDHFEKFFKYISWLLGGVEYYWAFPQPILKIVLVISMGVLGSLIFVTIEFIKEPRGQLKQRFNMYFFRPFLGMIVALAMYVLVKSGLSSIVDSTAEDLSPFLISFLGIVSGMLSEQAYKKIATTGNNMLTGGSAKDKEIEGDSTGD